MGWLLESVFGAENEKEDTRTEGRGSRKHREKLRCNSVTLRVCCKIIDISPSPGSVRPYHPAIQET